jgi:sialidase-1
LLHLRTRAEKGGCAPGAEQADVRRLLFPAVLIFALGAPRAAQPAKPDDVTRRDLFEAGAGGYALYRIPGLVSTKAGMLLAYCEARRTAAGDWGAIDVLLRRSPDGGTTWEPARKIVEPPAVPKNPVAVRQNLGRAGEVTVNNPVAIADPKSGVVHFLFCVEYARCFYMRSRDDGRTFSPPVDITPAFERFRSEYPWQVLATGPGHGLRLRSGRLIVPVWLSTGTGGHAHRPSAVSVIYSDDAGDTWERGEIVAAHPTLENPSETAAVERKDGSVLLNIRHEGAQRRRAVAVSADGAGRWSRLCFDAALPEPVCMGSLTRLSGFGRRERSRILFSNPHNPDDRRRRNLTVKLSYDEGRTWPVSQVLDPGVAGYSDLAVGPGRRIHCLYERGEVTAGQQYRTRALTLASFSLPWLTDGRDD